MTDVGKIGYSPDFAVSTITREAYENAIAMADMLAGQLRLTLRKVEDALIEKGKIAMMDTEAHMILKKYDEEWKK